MLKINPFISLNSYIASICNRNNRFNLQKNDNPFIVNTQKSINEEKNLLVKEIYTTGYVKDKSDNLISFLPISIQYASYLVINKFVLDHALSKTLEIGMAYGLSTLAICQAHETKGTGTHIAIDYFQTNEEDWKSIGLLNIERANLEHRLEFFDSYSHVALPQLLKENREIDFAFVDGSHSFDYIMVDFFYIDQMLEIGGYIAFDDIWMPAVRKILYFILKNKPYQLIDIHPQEGFSKNTGNILYRFLKYPLDLDFSKIKFMPYNICIIQKIDKDNRDWDFYRQF